MKQYLELLKDVLDHGAERDDRTGVGTKAVFGRMMRFDMRDGFPAVTTKKLAFRSVLAELLWFLKASQDVRELQKLNCRIWDANVEAEYWKPHQKFPGDAGRIYGVQWRRWRGSGGKEMDQLKKIVEWIKTNPTTRRMLITAWNPAELDVSYDPNDPKVALSPCHVLFQFFVSDGRLSLQMYQRSCDMFLGVPFNIASYSLLLHIIAAITKLEPGEFIHILGDTHIYKNHFEQVKEQLRREPYPLPNLKLNPAFYAIETAAELDAYINSIFERAAKIWQENEGKEALPADLPAKDLSAAGASVKEAKKKVSELLDEVAHLENYEHHPPIKAEMAV